ncbi:MAG TPA: response regulator [bacterium]|nr:response regulator [bacterium]
MAKRILIVDDEPHILLMVSTRLKGNGYEVLTAQDGQAGLDMARNEKPDAIILDLMLPKIDGYKVCGLLKRDARYSKIPIIIFTAKAQEEDQRLGKEMGADAYLIKPFTPEVLLETLAKLIN